MNKNQRIQNTIFLNKEFKKLNILHSSKRSKNGYVYNTKDKINKILNENKEIKIKYIQYIQYFKTEEEAKYCIRFNDDPENHKCPICYNNCPFYDNYKHKEYKETCGNVKCIESLANSNESICKGKQTKKKKYGNENYNNREKAKITSLIEYGEDNPAKCDKVKEKSRKTYMKKHNLIIDNNEIYELFDKFKKQYNLIDIENIDIYSKNEYFSKFIYFLYVQKNELLNLSLIVKIFKLNKNGGNIVKTRCVKLNLLQYFYIISSKFEDKFKSFILKNDFIEGNDFIHHNKSIIYPNEIDFYFKKYKLGFEINDVASHNITRKKGKYYHYNKSFQCLQKNIRLIHLWEWELTDNILWNRISAWIINLFNCQKHEVDVNNCIIKNVSIEEQKKFLNSYNIYGYIQNDISLGLYCNNDLIQIMTFLNNNGWQLLQFCTKFNYNIKNGMINLLYYFIKKYNLNSIYTYCDISKFSGKTYEDNDFKLDNLSEPNIIKYNSNVLNKKKKMYDCGVKKYVLNII